MSNKKAFYITTPIYYVNDRPHIGHAYCTILADVLARFHKLFGEDVYFLTGVDEHGQKVEEAARKRGMTPQAHCDEMQSHFRELWPTLAVSNDGFIRTTEPRHVRVVQEALRRLWEAGEIYRGEYEGYYSPRVEKFFSESELVDGKCPESGGDVYRLKEVNYFFRMSKYQDMLKAHIEANPTFILPESRRNEVLGFLQKPLQDLCISRPKSRLSWGIEIPFDPDYVTYVWFDALLNYCSAIGLYHDQKTFERWWPNAHHLIGKDILTTHCVYWTTMLMAMGLPLPKHIIAHGWWLVDRTKMSKSLGNVVDPLAMKDIYGVDSLRYFLMREMVVGLDADFSEEAFLRRHNFDLANDLGNLVNRLVRLVEQRFGGRVPEPSSTVTELDAELRSLAEGLPNKVRELVENLRIETAIEQTMALVRRVNRYVAQTEPFKLVKDDPARAGAVCYNSLEALRFALNLLAPVMPWKCEELLAAIGAGKPVESITDLSFGGLRAGSLVNLQKAPFPRYETVRAKEAVEVSSPPAVQSQNAYITFDDFTKIDMRVGTVVTAEPVQGSDRLLKMTVDIGENKLRQVVAGIGHHYTSQDLVGRQVILVANLVPRKFTKFKLESEGMILAVDDGGKIVALTTDRPVKPGSRVS